ncbi:MAG TPA: hypothetical protein VE445_01985 [Nitrososphaeraceae archaeon]|nr:hypothetical protein [Nitrososphaeraceae archaeon]
MHKSISIAVIALFLIASPSMMFGTSNSNLFSKAMAIEEDGFKTNLKPFIKSNELKDQGSSDVDRDKTSSIKPNELKESSFLISNELEDQGTSDEEESSKSSDSDEEESSKSSDSDEEESSKSSDSDEEESSKSSDATGNFVNQQVQSGASVSQLQCDECIEYWALAIKFLADDQRITISDAFDQFAAYFIKAIPDSLTSEEKTAAVNLMECVKERVVSLIAIEESQPIGKDTSLQTQINQSQMIKGAQQQSIPQQNLNTEKQIQQQQQQQQFEQLQLLPSVGQQNQNNELQKTELLPLPIQQNQTNESLQQMIKQFKQEKIEPQQQQQMTKQSQPVVGETTQQVQQTEKSEPQQQQQMIKQSKQENKGLSVITQEQMQQQQYENFKKLYESVKQQHKEIETMK